MLPYYLRHYLPLAERFVILDDGSTDGSLEILGRHEQIEVRRFQCEGDSLIESGNRVNNEIWKESRGAADWVIICDLDEHLYHPDLLGYLDRCKRQGVTVIPSIGYQMISHTFPDVQTRLCDAVTQGMRWDRMDKSSIFDPNRIVDINYVGGRHIAAPTGEVVFPPHAEVKLLHYKYLGIDYVVKRTAQLKPGLRKKDIERGLGHKYLWGEPEIRAEYEHIRANAVDAIRDGS